MKPLFLCFVVTALLFAATDGAAAQGKGGAATVVNRSTITQSELVQIGSEVEATIQQLSRVEARKGVQDKAGFRRIAKQLDAQQFKLERLLGRFRDEPGTANGERSTRAILESKNKGIEAVMRMLQQVSSAQQKLQAAAANR